MKSPKTPKRLFVRLGRVVLSMSYGKTPILHAVGKAPGELVSLR